MIERTFALAPDLRRLTFPLPTRPGHVHAYLLRGEDGWTLVDTGLALPDTAETIRAAAAELDGPIVRITTPHIPLPSADLLEDVVLPTVDRIADTVRRSLEA